MKALSILQPYAWLIVRPDLIDPNARQDARAADLIKGIENRGWFSKYKGDFLVHAGKAYSRRDHEEYAADLAEDFGISLPRYEDMPRGGIVGRATMTDCVKEHPSRWKMWDTWGFVLSDSVSLPFIPWRGQLGFFEVPDDAIGAAI